MSTAIISISKQGNDLALRISKLFDEVSCYTLPKWEQENFVPITGRLKDFTERLFAHHEALVFIMASGIVVRSIAPWLKDKTTDPAVVVMDERGQNVISLLSGHLGGANALCIKIADFISANAVITTASDINHLPSVDMLAQSKGMLIDSMQHAKTITAMIVNQQKVVLRDDKRFFEADVLPFIEGHPYGEIIVSNQEKILSEVPFVKLIPKNIYLGIGCKKGVLPEKLMGFVLGMISRMNLDLRSIHSISSIDVKENEPAIIYASQQVKCGLKFYSKEELQQVDHLFKGSDFVKSTVGVASVSSTSAYLSGGKTGVFLLTKEVKDGMTLSIFESGLTGNLPCK